MNNEQIKKLRLDTPGCHHLIHFNNAGCITFTHACCYSDETTS